MQHGGNSGGKDAQCLVPDGVTVRIVDRLEAIEVKQRDRQHPAIERPQPIGERFVEKSTVWQSRERIVARKTMGLRFRFTARFHLRRQVLVATVSIYEDGDAQDQNDENGVVDLPVRVIQSELKQGRRKIINGPDCKNHGPESRQNQGIAMCAALPICSL